MTDPRHPDDPYRTPLAGDELRRPSRFDNDLQTDPELAVGPAGGSRTAVFAIAAAVVLGAVFYGLNHSPINQAGTSSTAQNTQTSSSPPAAPPGMRDVTPRANTGAGVTTGAAPAQPQTPPPASNAPANNPTGK